MFPFNQCDVVPDRHAGIDGNDAYSHARLSAATIVRGPSPTVSVVALVTSDCEGKP